MTTRKLPRKLQPSDGGLGLLPDDWTDADIGKYLQGMYDALVQAAADNCAVYELQRRANEILEYAQREGYIE